MSEMEEFQQFMQQKMQGQLAMEKLLQEKLPDILGIPVPGSIVAVDGTEYRMLEGFDSVVGYALCVPLSDEGGNERKVMEPVILYLPETVKFAEEVANNPMALLQKLTALADTEGIPAAVRDELGDVESILNLLAQS